MLEKSARSRSRLIFAELRQQDGFADALRLVIGALGRGDVRGSHELGRTA